MRLNTVTLGGDGPPIVLLHGLFGASRNLHSLQKALAADGHRVLALDLRNHGDSPHAAGMSYGEMAADVRETLGAMDALPCALLGHSMGGKVAMRLALDQPGLVSRLVVADIAPRGYRHGNREIAAAMLALPLHPGMTRAEANRALADGVADPATRSFLLLSLRLGGEAMPAWRIGLAEIAAEMATIEGWENGAPPYPGPSLFISGARSTYVSETDQDAIRALFPAAQFAVLPNAGHWLHAEDPAGFLGAVEPFLKAASSELETV
jgi:esterase